ncbi:MAG: DUF378 domain-containing protein [Patescibacteria group bacterium]|jgi:hypothetical protein
MKKMSVLDWIAMVLLIIGGLNWGLVGVAKFDLVGAIFKGTNEIGSDATIAKIVYILVGLSALYMLIMAFAKKDAAAQPMQPMQK